MNPGASNLDGHALAARYEALRQDVVTSRDCCHTVHSLALLMRKGMAAWIKGVREKLPVHNGTIPRASAATRIPDGIDRSLVDIVATMALTTALEVVT